MIGRVHARRGDPWRPIRHRVALLAGALGLSVATSLTLRAVDGLGAQVHSLEQRIRDQPPAIVTVTTPTSPPAPAAAAPKVTVTIPAATRGGPVVVTPGVKVTIPAPAPAAAPATSSTRPTPPPTATPSAAPKPTPPPPGLRAVLCPVLPATCPEGP